MGIARSPVWSDPRVKPPYGAVEVDRGHSLAHGLEALWLFNEGAGPPHDLLERFHMTAPGNSMVWVPSRNGMAVDFPDSNGGLDYFQFITMGLPTTATVTMAAMFEADDVTAFNSIFENRTNGLQGLLLASSVGNPFTFSWDAAVDEYAGATGLAITLNQPYIGVAALTASDAVLYLGAVGGALTSYLNSNTNAAKTLNGTWRVGNDPTDPTTSEWDGRISWIALWSRTLAAGDVRELHTKPYAFLRPIIRRRYFVPAAAAAAGGSATRRRLTLLGVGS